MDSHSCVGLELSHVLPHEHAHCSDVGPAMTKAFTFEAWDAWQQPLTRLLQGTAMEPLDPCREAYLDVELRS